MTDDLMVEAIRSVTLNQPEKVGVQDAAAPQAVASPGAVERFEAVMEVDKASETGVVNGIPFAEQVASLWRSTQASNQEYVHRIKALSELNASQGFTSADLLRLQYDVASLSFQQEVVAKVADKSSNAVQTLIKNQ